VNSISWRNRVIPGGRAQVARPAKRDHGVAAHAPPGSGRQHVLKETKRVARVIHGQVDSATNNGRNVSGTRRFAGDAVFSDGFPEQVPPGVKQTHTEAVRGTAGPFLHFIPRNVIFPG